MDINTGYLDIDRSDPGYRELEDRIKDYSMVEKRLSNKEIREQAHRCMDCGTPYCDTHGCPVKNLIPEFNEMLYQGHWREALNMLLENNSFPEFTAAICPAPCETSCILLINDDAVTIRQIEREIIENGFQRGLVKPMPPRERLGQSVAVVGSGPAGMAVAQKLNRAGASVIVFERAANVGGLLRYGIPDFKMDKQILERRLELMRAEGVVFEPNTAIGEDISTDYLIRKFDAICLAGGAREPRDLNVQGRELKGVHFAMEFLTQQNKIIANEPIDSELISAAGKRVVVIGGGDTGSDCIGTSVRQGAAKVYQLEIMPKPPADRNERNPWPEWPRVVRTSSSHEEGCERRWSVNTKRFIGDAEGSIRKLVCCRVEWKEGENGFFFEEVPNTEFEIEAELVLLAMGFSGPARNDVEKEIDFRRDQRGNIWTDSNHMTSVAGIFSAGDMREGQSLVVNAIFDGQEAAKDILKYLQTKGGASRTD